jgi:uncharacterized membrane protein YgcG
MSFLAKLEVGGTEYNILNVEYDISQVMDQNHRPNGAPRGGLIHIVLESGNNNDLVEWMVQKDMIKNGKITFYRRDANSQMKTVSFKDAFCVHLKEVFIADGKNPMVTKITVSAREMTINKSTITNAWAGMNSSSSSSSGSSSSSSGGGISSFSPMSDEGGGSSS